MAYVVCPKKDGPMLAPRLAMLMKGTAWAQIKPMETEKLTDAEQGIKILLEPKTHGKKRLRCRCMIASKRYCIGRHRDRMS
jgi:hypothetical protein